ncbi:hypothetical protein [Kitasatospora sp. NPDC096204]|uniref:hypothetical protein n=1 Tax=Kitasatospora sp. NPDC096204 TaxID=3364094 RepID=UPI00381AE6DF
MAAVPASARGFIGVAIAVIAFPMLLVTARFGLRLSIAAVVATVCVALCAVPLGCARPGGFRAATVVAGCAVGLAAVVAGVLLLLGGVGFGRPDCLLLGIVLPIAGIAPPVAAFQRARGAEYGHRPAVLGGSAAALSAVGWLLVVFV